MATGVRIGFEQATLELPLDRLAATRSLGKQFRQMERYKRILASIREIGLVEPLVVHPSKGAAGAFLLLDGHLRLEALRELGVAQARCLVSTDDEGYTYNRHVNRISTFQEHFMVMKALNAGVSEERLARALNVDVRRIREKRDLLRGICPEAVAMLKKRDVAASAVYYFR
jgi:ParB-like chromosome segregation protein Spo0J